MYQNKRIIYHNLQFRQFVTLAAIGILFDYIMKIVKLKINKYDNRKN
jgi:hypothetical protein